MPANWGFSMLTRVGRAWRRSTIRLSALVLAAIAMTGTARAQALVGQSNSSPEPQRHGFQIYSVSTFGGYSDVNLPNGSGSLQNGGGVQPSGLPLGSGLYGGASAAAGWARFGQRTNFSLLYRGTYTAFEHYPEWNSFDHFLSLSSRSKLGAKWDLAISGVASDIDLRHFLFTPAVVDRVTSAPGTFDDLAQAMLSGRFTNDQLASILTGAPVVESPLRAVLYGNRALAMSLQSTVSYEHSQRLSFHFGAGALHTQHLADHSTAAPQYYYVVPRATNGRVSAGLSYALTPRTHFGLDVGTSRTISIYQDAYTTTTNASLGRVMGRRWFLQARAGVAEASPLRSTYSYRQGPRYLAGGSVAYKTLAHTFLLSHDHTVADIYGIGAYASQVSTAAWSWWRPGRSWGLNSSVRNHYMKNTGFGNLEGVIADVGIARSLTRSISLRTDYAYLVNSGRLSGISRDLSANSVRFSVVWTPGIGGLEMPGSQESH